MASRSEEIYRHLRDGIKSGLYQPGTRLPTETFLAKKFNASRPTSARALNRLVADGLINRRVGSGSYVLENSDSKINLKFGILIPGLGSTEIFEPICGEIVSGAQQHGASVIWATGARGTRSDEQLISSLMIATHKLMEEEVDGVFFAPLELNGEMNEVNHAIIEELKSRNLPVVLLDRDFMDYPSRSSYDLVGINNARSGYVITQHMLEQKPQKIVFLSFPHSATTVSQRIAGFRHALVDYQMPISQDNVKVGDPNDTTWVKQMIDSSQADAIVCANDVTATALMKSLRTLGIDVPGEIIIAGFDDVSHAKMLSPSLTTIHQPTDKIGALALETMISRINNPKLPAREIRAETYLVKRESTQRTQATTKAV